jgi:predicted nuclease with TOPRIM domain
VSFAESLRALRRDRDQVKERLAENRRQATNLVKMMARMDGEPPDAMLQQSQEFERERTVLEETLSPRGHPGPRPGDARPFEGLPPEIHQLRDLAEGDPG